MEQEHDNNCVAILYPFLSPPIHKGIAFVFKTYYNTIKNEVFYEDRRDMYVNPQTPDLKEITARNHCK